MPNWKKLIVSGSDATLNSLNVSDSITGVSATLGDITASGNILLKSTEGALQGYDGFGGTTIPLVTNNSPLGAVFGDFALEGVSLNSKNNFAIQTSGSGALGN